jgi:predicted porin
MFRAEYIHSQGWGSGSVGNSVINYDLGDKADGWYAFGIVPIIKSKLHAKARYQTYRVKKEWGSAKTSYEVGLNYFFNKHMEMHLEYARINDKSLKIENHSYNLVDLEFDFKF